MGYIYKKDDRKWSNKLPDEQVAAFVKKHGDNFKAFSDETYESIMQTRAENTPEKMQEQIALAQEEAYSTPSYPFTDEKQIELPGLKQTAQTAMNLSKWAFPESYESGVKGESFGKQLETAAKESAPAIVTTGSSLIPGIGQAKLVSKIPALGKTVIPVIEQGLTKYPKLANIVKGGLQGIGQSELYQGTENLVSPDKSVFDVANDYDLSETALAGVIGGGLGFATGKLGDIFTDAYKADPDLINAIGPTTVNSIKSKIQSNIDKLKIKNPDQVITSKQVEDATSSAIDESVKSGALLKENAKNLKDRLVEESKRYFGDVDETLKGSQIETRRKALGAASKKEAEEVAWASPTQMKLYTARGIESLQSPESKKILGMQAKQDVVSQPKFQTLEPTSWASYFSPSLIKATSTGKVLAPELSQYGLDKYRK